MNPLPSRLLVVTDRHQSIRPLSGQVTELLRAGARWIWLRDRDLPSDARRCLAETLTTTARLAGASLSVGADIALAAEVGAAGVHLRTAADIAAARRTMGASAIVGVSAHSLAEALDAADRGADYVTLSPIFGSASKPGYGPALGLLALEQAVALGIPVLALGGVTVENAEACMAAGAAGIAVMGPLMRAKDAACELSRLLSDVSDRAHGDPADR